MAEFKLVIADKSGKSTQKECKDDAAISFLNKKIGDKVDGDALALQGYTFEITGGSDYCGFPLRKGIPGLRRKQIMAGKGVGFRSCEKGTVIRKSVCPDIITDTTKQINVKILQYGTTPLFENAQKADEKGAAS